ncbi:phage holin family protein [Escherichia coli]|uniref:phage holin family protein n=1 Tax=Escherichia coli TaxID=562 RepID=UPI00207B9379|nr:phage holin family protein [Escherichia coli]
MTAEEKSVLSLFMIGVLIVVGKVLAGGEPITPRLFIGRMLLGGFVSMVAGVVLVQFPDLSLPAVCGIGSMLGIAGYQVIEIAAYFHERRSLNNFHRDRVITFEQIAE